MEKGIKFKKGDIIVSKKNPGFGYEILEANYKGSGYYRTFNLQPPHIENIKPDWELENYFIVSLSTKLNML